MTDETHLRTYKNGAVVDPATGRIVSGKGNTTKITKDNAADMVKQRMNKKRQVMIAAANAATSPDMREAHGDLAFMAAIAEAQQRKAADSADPKSTAAANFVIHHTGYSDPTTQAAPVDASLETLQLLRELAAFARTVQIPADAVDGEIIEDDAR